MMQQQGGWRNRAGWRGLVGVLAGVAIFQQGSGAEWREDFAAAPAGRGWRARGAAELFRWDAAGQRLEVTWDSRQPNSYFYRSLGTVLTRSNDFSVSFSLIADRIQPGIDPAKRETFQLAIGLIGLTDAVRSNYFRGAGIHPLHGPRSALEFLYFPDTGFGATIAPTIVSSNNQYASSFNFPLELSLNDRFDVALEYRAAAQTLTTRVRRNGNEFGPIQAVMLPDAFTDFRLDTLAVSSYSDTGQEPPEFAGSLLAHGWIDDIRVAAPDPPVRGLAIVRAAEGVRLEFEGEIGWDFEVERSHDLALWETLGKSVAAGGQRQQFLDSSAVQGRAFYRIRAVRL